MRTILYIGSLLTLTISIQGRAEDARVNSTCNGTLAARLVASPNQQAECTVTITHGQNRVTRTFRARAEEDANSEGQLLLCDTRGDCTEGATQKHALDFNNLTASIIEAMGKEAVGAPTATASTKKAVGCDAKGDSEEILSCHLLALRKTTDAAEAADYYQGNIERKLLQLAKSKNDEDTLLLRRTILTYHTDIYGAARQSQILAESLSQFDQFLGYRQELANLTRQYRAALSMNPLPGMSPELINHRRETLTTEYQTQRRGMLSQAGAYFQQRARLTGIDDEVLNETSNSLLAILRQSDENGAASAAATGGGPDGGPRRQFGAPGGMPAGGIVPRRVGPGGNPFRSN